MMRRESFEAVDRSLKDICGNNEPFGGILTICSGDFRQLLPVVKRGNDADVHHKACIKMSYSWRQFTKFHSKQNMRLQEEDDYAKILIKVGEDKIEKRTIMTFQYQKTQLFL